MFEHSRNGWYIVLFDGVAELIESLCQGIQGVENVESILLQNVLPELHTACRDSGGISPTTSHKRQELSGGRGGQGGSHDMRNVAGHGQCAVMFGGCHLCDRGTKGHPKVADLINVRGGVQVGGCHDDLAVLQQIGSSGLHAREVAASQRMTADKPQSLSHFVLQTGDNAGFRAQRHR